MDWTEKGICVRCNKGGRVLICSDSGCPIAIHANCLKCVARFDANGNFYCPYCLCKQAAVELRHARERAMSKKKALSTFLVKEIITGDLKNQKSGTDNRREPLLSTADSIDNLNNVIELDHKDVCSDSVQLGKDQKPETATFERTTSTLPCQKLDKQSTDKGDSILLIRCGGDDGLNDAHASVLEPHHNDPNLLSSPELDDYDAHTLDVDPHHKHSDLTVACAAHGVCCEEVTDQFTIVSVGKKDQAVSQRDRNDALMLEKAICRRAESPELLEQEEKTNASSTADEPGLQSNSKSTEEDEANDLMVHKTDQTEGQRDGNNALMLKETICRRAKSPEMLKQEDETNAFSAAEEPGLLANSESNKEVEAKDSMMSDPEIVATGMKHMKVKPKKTVRSTAICSPRRSSRSSSSGVGTDAVQKKVDPSTKSRLLGDCPKSIINSAVLNVKRKRLPWTTEEEEMLREGVQKFSTTRHKNIPWRKILEFGHRVFDPTRAPVDLKDKWRNISCRE